MEYTITWSPLVAEGLIFISQVFWVPRLTPKKVFGRGDKIRGGGIASYIDVALGIVPDGDANGVVGSWQVHRESDHRINDQRCGGVIAIQMKSNVAIGFDLIFGVDRRALAASVHLINHRKVLGNPVRPPRSTMRSPLSAIRKRFAPSKFIWMREGLAPAAISKSYSRFSPVP